MIHAIETQKIVIEGGVMSATLSIKTERGVVAQLVAFKLKDHPELDAWLPMIDKDIRAVCEKVLGMKESTVLPAKA